MGFLGLGRFRDIHLRNEEKGEKQNLCNALLSTCVTNSFCNSSNIKVSFVLGTMLSTRDVKKSKTLPCPCRSLWSSGGGGKQRNDDNMVQCCYRYEQTGKGAQRLEQPVLPKSNE